MQIKKGAMISGLTLVMRPVLVYANQIWNKYGQELVVTSGLDGTHSAGSLHYYGLAVDFRSRYFNKKLQKQVVKELQNALGGDYDVVLHRTHIHAEFDRGN